MDQRDGCLGIRAFRTEVGDLCGRGAPHNGQVKAEKNRTSCLLDVLMQRNRLQHEHKMSRIFSSLFFLDPSVGTHSGKSCIRQLRVARAKEMMRPLLKFGGGTTVPSAHAPDQNVGSFRKYKCQTSYLYRGSVESSDGC